MATTLGKNARFLFKLLMLTVIALPVIGNPASRPERGIIEDIKQETAPRLCLTGECIDAAARIRRYIDPNVDPCDDFYEFACGNWKRNQILAPDMSLIPSFEGYDNKIAAIKNILSVEPKPEDLESIVKAKNMYTSCIAYAKKERDLQGLKDFIEKEFGAWPLTLAEWDASSFDLETFLAKALQFGVPAILSLREQLSFLEDEDTGLAYLYYKLLMAPPSLGLHKNSYQMLLQSDHVMRDIYKEKILKTAKIFGVENEGRAKQDIQDMLEFESTLMNITMEGYGDEYVNTTFTLRDLEDDCGPNQVVDWKNLLMKLLSSPEVGIKDFDYEKITVYGKGYFHLLTSYLPDVKKRTLANYIIWRVVHKLESVLIPDDEKMNFLYKEILEGKPPVIPAQESCMDYVADAFDQVLHRLMYAAKFPEEEMHRIRVMMNKIQNIFDDRLEEMDWLDVHTKTVILEKRRIIETVFLHFDKVMNDTYLNQFYSNLTVSKENFFNNLVTELKERAARGLRLIGQPKIPFRFDISGAPWDIEAFIMHRENIIRFSASIFEPPFFTYNVPQSLNYGGIGVVLGHELTHAFDNNGYKINEEGIPGQWWSEEAISNFKQRHECMIDQYSSFYFSEAGANIFGNYTLGENIADNGGLGQSFNAYRSWICSRGEEEETLPSIPYDNNQLFFISFAHTWCGVISKEDATYYLFDPHSPPRFRVIGTLQNSRDFAEAFNCPAGSYMNPTTKCEVW